MNAIFDLAVSNLISPIILSFALGLAAAWARSDLTIPEAVAKGMSIYLLFAIGFKGGASVAAHGVVVWPAVYCVRTAENDDGPIADRCCRCGCALWVYLDCDIRGRHIGA